MIRASVVQKVDNAIHWRYNSIEWIAQLVSLVVSLVINPVDSALHLLNIWGQD